MSMRSSRMLPVLQKLPSSESGQHRSFRDVITDVVNMDSGMYAAEFASATSLSMWAVFDSNNVDDRLFEAYQTRWPRMSEDHSLHEQVSEDDRKRRAL